MAQLYSVSPLGLGDLVYVFIVLYPHIWEIGSLVLSRVKPMTYNLYFSVQGLVCLVAG